MYDVDLKSICSDIRKFCFPKKVRWFCIGVRFGKKVWMSESAIRLASVDEICADKNLEPAPRRFRLRRRSRS